MHYFIFELAIIVFNFLLALLGTNRENSLMSLG